MTWRALTTAFVNCSTCIRVNPIQHPPNLVQDVRDIVSHHLFSLCVLRAFAPSCGISTGRREGTKVICHTPAICTFNVFPAAKRWKTSSKELMGATSLTRWLTSITPLASMAMAGRKV